MRLLLPSVTFGDSHLPNHAHLVVQGADVREDSGVRESDAETCHAKGQLWKPAPFLKRLNDEPRMICQCALFGKRISNKKPPCGEASRLIAKYGCLFGSAGYL